MPSRIFHPICVICAGEDPRIVLRVARNVTARDYDRAFSFRCYQFHLFDEFLLIWTGIGTGCLEPLLYELNGIASPDIIQLVGTAGAAGHEAVLGHAYAVSGAHAVCSAVSSLGVRPSIRLLPNWSSKPKVSARIISTDFYYDQLATNRITRAARKHGCSLVDMETAQFYHICSRLSQRRHGGDTKFIAYKAAANVVGAPHAQNSLTPAALMSCFEKIRQTN